MFAAPNRVYHRNVAHRRVAPNPALDGLRGVAIAAVVLFHFPVTRNYLPGGLFGVGLFFVLSGFLVTPILAEQFDRRGRVSLGEFYRRRAWRLLPALGAFLLVFVLADSLFGRNGWFASNPFGPPHQPGAPVPIGQALLGSGAALGYVYNFFLAHSVSMPSPLGHLWTLSVEGQFYAAWAIGAAFLLRRGPRVLAAVTCSLIALSAAAPFLAWDHGAAQNWIYFSTGPRVQQLLAGALLGEMWSRGALRRVPARVLSGTAAAGTGAIAYLMLEVGNVPLKYLGAFTIVAAGGCALVACLVDERSGKVARRLLGWRPLVWLGKRSYAVYLWHWPLAEWTNELPYAIGVPLGIGCSLVAAELSWRIIELPAQRLSKKRASDKASDKEEKVLAAVR